MFAPVLYAGYADRDQSLSDPPSVAGCSVYALQPCKASPTQAGCGEVLRGPGSKAIVALGPEAYV
jgi:hypothetical protein